MNPIIEVKGVGKKYLINHERGRYVALRDVLAGIIKKPFAFLANKARQVAGMESREDFWALRNVSFDVQKGEVIGIIGRNGAGKSTLLKILSQITPPTEGEIILRGRVGSLLEVGTGFHPELTGRENIFLNGAILGMKRTEIAKKFDQIVEFAGVDRFLDTPVKRYSSGMYVRLAFSVAAHMEPDILIVDEVLAVGDAEFQKKCLGKMQEVTQKEGRTILFVSHNMAAVERLCKKTIWMEGGKIKQIGETSVIIDAYLNGQPIIGGKEATEKLAKRADKKGPHFKGIDVSAVGGGPVKSDSRLQFKLEYANDTQGDIIDPQINIIITDEVTQKRVLFIDSAISSETLSEHIPSHGIITCETAPINLKAGRYSITIWFIAAGANRDVLENILQFEVTTTDIEKFNFRLQPGKDFPSNIISYTFKNK